ncbi:MAG: hypothetical protein IE933_13600 [Sphingomonadales bacterium]|nr:hypothetical protein [Sphingomonadales bacterium]MBD3774984.1 hypothetical protein [Paracoccaceae bacterium]
MTMDHSIARIRISREMREAEVALDEALIRQSNLMATMIQARRETGASPFTGHEALLRLAKSQQTLLSASGDIARAHGAMLKVQEEITGFDKCPPNEPMGIADEDDRLFG